MPYRITMAAIDSSTTSSKPSTLKLHKRVVTAVPESDEEEAETMEDGDESTEEEFVICTLEAGKVGIVPKIKVLTNRHTSKHWILLCRRTMRSISRRLVICTTTSPRNANLDPFT